MSSLLAAARAGWRWRGEERPPWAVEPGEGQESVWDYPRPPVVEPVGSVARVVLEGIELARSERSIRVLETASAPAVYLPVADIRMDFMVREDRGGICEWKGPWVFWSIVVGQRRVRQAAWSYLDPWPGFEDLRDRLAFYPARVDTCWLGDQGVEPQPGGFYGGWVTPDIVGPIKGEPGSGGW